MKIKYAFATETVEIEVDETWGTVLVDLDRQEYNNNHAETRRHCSLDAYGENHRELTSENDSLTTLLSQETTDAIEVALSQLKPAHRELIQALFFDGMSNEEYAGHCGVTPGAISQRKATALKKFKKYFGKT